MVQKRLHPSAGDYWITTALQFVLLQDLPNLDQFCCEICCAYNYLNWMQYQNYIRGTVAKQISANQISFVTLNAFFFYKSMCKIRVYIKLFTSMNVKSNFQKNAQTKVFFSMWVAKFSRKVKVLQSALHTIFNNN